MGYMVNTRRFWELVKQLESDDEPTARKALEATGSVPHVPTRLSLLEHAARHCGSPQIATKAFEKLCQELRPFTAEEKAGQVEDIIRYGSKVPAIRFLAMKYALELVERGELDRTYFKIRSIVHKIIANKQKAQ